MIAETTPGLALEVLASESQAEALLNEWKELWNRASSKTVFQRPEWLMPWWRHLGTGEMRIICCRSEGRLVGILPLTVHSADGGARHALLLGNGVTDYLDALAETELETEVSNAFLA